MGEEQYAQRCLHSLLALEQASHPRWCLGVIESQANEGQIKHNQALAKRIGEWIAAHPDDFPVETAPEPAGESTVDVSTCNEPEPTEETPLLGGGNGAVSSAVSQPISILVLSNIVTFVLLIWSWTRPCPC